MKSVVIVQSRLTRYREPLFDALRRRCRERDIELHLIHGGSRADAQDRQDEGQLPWARRVDTLPPTFAGRDLAWLSLPADLTGADLLIIPQESRILSNYPLLLGRLWSRRKIAYWGHGANFQSGAPHGWRERWKRMLLGRVDWWFAYTNRTREVLRDAGFPETRITVLNNAIDNATFEADLGAITADELAALRKKVGAGDTAPVGLFCGSLYAEKRLDFLVAAAMAIRTDLPDFQLVVIGDGPARDELMDRIADKPWIHALGALHGREKAGWFRLAGVMLSPGLVGLNILDAFCAGLPLFTTHTARHSPEIAYLEDGRNGFMLDDDAFATAVVTLLGDPERIAAIRCDAAAAAKRYTLDAMVENFAQGIVSCLEEKRP